MKTPPLLLGAALLFWGWQTGFLVVGVCMAVVLEGSRLIKLRWEFSDEDFTRIWTFCTLLCLAAAVFAFTDNQGPASFEGFFQNPDPATTQKAGAASAQTAVAMVRWLPMLFFLFIGAQAFSTRQAIPLETISLILRARWKRARKAGLPAPAGHSVDVAYPYFILCLLAASANAGEGRQSFFWGFCLLLAWALWAQRSPRFSIAVWAFTLTVAIGLGYAGQRGLIQLQRYLDSFNPQWFSFAGFQSADPARSRTGLGHIGRLKLSAKIVIRLDPKASPAPKYLREASYRTYRKQVWFSELSTNDFQHVSPTEPNGNNYELLPGKTNAFTANIACYLPGRNALLPLPAGCGRLEDLPVYILQKNSLGAVLAQGPGLVVFNAAYGPGATLDAPPGGIPGPTNADLAVPDAEVAALDQVVAEQGLQGQSREQVLRGLQNFFQNQFTYSTWQSLPKRTERDESPLSRFLLRARTGHCEYFATATVLLLRRLNIPARYAVGYAVHETSGRKYVVRQRDAHAWCLAWNEQRRLWENFDTTPPSWIAEEAKQASRFQFLSDLWSRITFEFSKLRWGQTHLRQYVLWALAPILALLLYQILFRSRKRQRQAAAAASEPFHWPGLDSEFYQLQRELAKRGLPRGPSEPLSDWLQRALAAPGLDALREPLLSLLRLHYRYRFDPQGLSKPDREQLRQEAKACLARLEQAAITSGE